MKSLTGQSSTPLLPSPGLACMPIKHKERCQSKSKLTPTESIHPLNAPKSNNDTPHEDELDKSAKVWCELILGFISERNIKQHAQGAIKEEILENIN